MAFDRPQSTPANSLFPFYQHESGFSLGGWSNGKAAVPFGSIPSVSLHNKDMSSCIPWSHNVSDDPYDLMNCMQNIKCRNPPHIPDDGETDLQSLVSNIVDEADSHDSFYSDGNRVQYNPIWSPKLRQEELLQYFQSEAKTQNSFAFPPNHVSCESFTKTQGQAVDKSDDEFYKQSNGPANQLFNFTNGDGDIYTLSHQNLPPGRPVPNMVNMSQKQRNYDGMAVNKNRGNRQMMNNFPDLSDVFRPQHERNSPCIDSHAVDHYMQTNGRLTNDQYMPQDINQLVSSFQSFMAGGEQDAVYCGDFPNMQMQTVKMQHEDSTAWKDISPVTPPKSTSATQFQSPATPKKSTSATQFQSPVTSKKSSSTQFQSLVTPKKPTSATQFQKQPVAEYGSMQRERNVEMRKQTFQRDAPQLLPGFGPQNNEYFQQAKPVPLYPPNQYQTKMTANRASLPLPINMNQYSQHPIQQGHIQNKIKPQMQKKKMARLVGKHFSTVSLTDGEMGQHEKKQALSQNPDFNFTDDMQTFYGENGIVSTRNTSQFTPLTYSVSDPRRQSSLPIETNSPKSAAYDTSVPGMDLTCMSGNEPAGFNSSPTDTMSRREENTHHGLESSMTPSRKGRGPVSELNVYLDECYEEWRCLEKERKKTEIILSKTFLRTWTVGETNTSLLKAPPNSTRLQCLIVNQLREQAQVASLLDKLEYLCRVRLRPNIDIALFRHLTAIYIIHGRYKEELAYMSQQHQANFTEERDTSKLVVALKDLVATTSNLRTALVRAVQRTLPEPKRLEQHVSVDATHTGKCPLFDGCSFKL